MLSLKFQDNHLKLVSVKKCLNVLELILQKANSNSTVALAYNIKTFTETYKGIRNQFIRLIDKISADLIPSDLIGDLSDS